MKKDETLINKESVSDYIQEWTHILEQIYSSLEIQNKLSVIVFRLGKEWLALPTLCLKEVQSHRPIHSFPHLVSPILLGIINLNGEIQLYISLHRLLKIEEVASMPLENIHLKSCVIAIFRKESLWVFPVDEIDGIHRYDTLSIENTFFDSSHALNNYLKGKIRINQKKVCLLDEELIFASLNRCVS